MKKKRIFELLFMISIVTACATDTNESKEEIQVQKEDRIQEKPNEENATEDLESIEDTDTVKETETVKDTIQKPMYKINDAHWGVEPLENANDKVVLLTIDDAPDQYGLQMAEVLKEQGVKAIFFVNGHFIDSAEEKAILKQIYDLGFSIGNHTWNHKNLKNLSEEEQFQEIVKLSDEIEAITGARPSFFRAPFGANTDYARKLVKTEGMVLMNWTYGYDFMKDYMTKDSIADIMVNTPLLTNGANLLIHDREWTFLALPEIVNGLKEKEYEFVDPKTIETGASSY
ncbi:polysaccharide deacetylase family protein [Bacillus sp. DJP31]|uniref:polysaccharide deacetylase family protein n=1 Tax=Bacillus sp. DJP31 TaxID=3409789 RepID=UPI003BB4E8FC